MLTDGIVFGSPAGLSVTTDEALQAILTDLEGWRAALPEELQFRGPQTPRNAGTPTSSSGRAAAAVGTLVCRAAPAWRTCLRVTHGDCF